MPSPAMNIHQDAASVLVAAEALYLESLRQLANWVQTDNARASQGLPDTNEHLMSGLKILEGVSTSAGETVSVHNQAFISLQRTESGEVEQLLARRDRFIGTTPHLAQMFDRLVKRLSCSASAGLH